MLSVLIADDEKKVGLLIKNLIEWEKLGLSFLDIVQDGRSAYEIILQKRPDIVITDIRMPGLTGLEIVEKISKTEIDVHFIIISGYRYFDYAQKALKYGVKDYLLKPVEEVELNRILKKVCEEVAVKRDLSSRMRTLEKNLTISRHELHRELMERIYESDETLDERYQGGHFPVEMGLYRAVSFKIDRNIETERNLEQEQLIMQKFSDKISESLEEFVLDLVISVRGGMRLIVLLNFRDEVSGKIWELLEESFVWLKRYIGGFEGCEATMGLSRETSRYSEINLVLEMAYEAVEYRILSNCGICQENFSWERNSEYRAEDLIEMQREEIRKSISIFQKEDLRRGIDNCFLEASRLYIMASEYYELGRKLVEEYEKCAEELFCVDIKEQVDIWKETIGHCRTVASLKKYVGSTLENHLGILEKIQWESKRRPILEAIEYVKKNYGQKILLEDVAAVSGFNTNYFSELFKKETGKNFTFFLLEVRIEASKKLLANTSKTVYEIASEVGYKDAKFFSQQFTKVVGIKPKEYRRLYF